MSAHHSYDLMLLLDRRLEAERRAEILGSVEKLIGESGSLIGKHEWGTRVLAFDIDHQPDAEYHLIQFSGPRELLGALDHALKITDGVARFRVIKLPRNAPPPPPPPKAATAVALEADPEDTR